MTGTSYRPVWITGLSGRLLALTILFVMLSEVLIYVPSIARFRKVYLEEHLARAHVAVLAVEATSNNMVEPDLERMLLFHARSHVVVLKEPTRRILMLDAGPMPPIDVSIDMRTTSFVEWITDAVATLLEDGNRVLRVIGPSPRVPEATLEVLLEEDPLRQAMVEFSWRILTLSIIISLITASLVYFSLQRLMVAPVLRIAESMMRFRENPEDETCTLPPTRRSDEIGMAQRELIAMQRDLRSSLRQKMRLAAVGAAVAKINHDLRNSLSTALLASDRLADIGGPEVKRLATRLCEAMDRAIALCSQTLHFVRADEPPLEPERFCLKDLIGDLAESLSNHGPQVDFVATSGRHDLPIDGDRRQLFRAFDNLALNAAQAGARTLRLEAEEKEGALVITLADDGPGIPAPVHERLFQPFSGTGRRGGSGLGLAIAREIVRAHGGDVELSATGSSGTTFRIRLPAQGPGQSCEADGHPARKAVA
jgi:signal transduction histidine kinase